MIRSAQIGLICQLSSCIAVLFVAASLGISACPTTSSGSGQPKSSNKTPDWKRPSDEVIKKWKEAGAEVGYFDDIGLALAAFCKQDEGKLRGLFAFSLKDPPKGLIKTLPQPDCPFGLELDVSDDLAGALREARQLKLLRSLTFRSFKLPDDAAKELGRFVDLSSLNLFAMDMSDNVLEPVAQLVELTRLNVGYTKVSDQSLKLIGRLQNLKALGLGATPITDDGIDALLGCTQLEELDLAGTKVTQKGLQNLTSLKNIRRLDLSGTGLGDSVVPTIAGFKKLQDLDLALTQVSNKSFSDLAKIESLERLSFSAMDLTGDNTKHLAALPRLRELEFVLPLIETLGKPNVTPVIDDAAAKQLALLPHLERLEIAGLRIKDASLMEFAQTKSLKHLLVAGPSTTEGGKEKLRKARPDLNVR
jgi:internalin A